MSNNNDEERWGHWQDPLIFILSLVILVIVLKHYGF